MNIHYLQHVPFEGPGSIRLWAEQAGRELTGTQLYRNETLPDIEQVDALVIMGGPMSVHDENRHPWLQREKEFIADCIAREKKVLGICLGAQLIADVLGAKVKPMEHKEIGWFPLEWTETARRHPVFDYLPATHPVLHWHGEHFEIHNDALQLASSEACETQAFLWKNHVLGLQFHLEMTKEGLADLIANSKQELELAGGPWVQQPDEMFNRGHFEENQTVLNKLLDRFFGTSNFC
tara:strand:- start:2873 stop:3580 length:708 start_codon:yes stop_codon:yes gene_type:complete